MKIPRSRERTQALTGTNRSTTFGSSAHSPLSLTLFSLYRDFTILSGLITINIKLGILLTSSFAILTSALSWAPWSGATSLYNFVSCKSWLQSSSEERIVPLDPTDVWTVDLSVSPQSWTGLAAISQLNVNSVSLKYGIAKPWGRVCMCDFGLR